MIAAFRDLGTITVDGSNPSVISTAASLNSGQQTRAGVAQGIIYSGLLYFTNTVVSQINLYIPDQSQGVLPSGAAPPTGQITNPSPGLVNYFLGLYLAGYSDERVITAMLTSPQYFNTVSYYSGLYRSPGIRY